MDNTRGWYLVRNTHPTLLRNNQKQIISEEIYVHLTACFRLNCFRPTVQPYPALSFKTEGIY